MLESPSPVFLEPLFLYRAFHSDQEHSPGLDSEIQHVYLDLNSGKPHQACQPLTDLRRCSLVRLRLGVGPNPGPGHTSQAGSHPDSPGSLLPAYSWPGQALIPTPFTGLTQEERFVCPGGRNKMEQSCLEPNGNVFSDHVPSPA